MTSLPLLEWVESWLDDPREYFEYPYDKDREWCYMALTYAIGNATFNRARDVAQLSEKDKRRIHHLFVYLLLGWNFMTGKEKPTAFVETDKPNSVDIIVVTDEVKRTYERLLDFSKPVPPGAKYVILNQIMKVVEYYRKMPRSSIRGEEVTMLLASVWLLQRDEPYIRLTNRVSVRNCLGLAGDVYTYNAKDDGLEYSGAGDVKYEAWFLRQIERLFRLNVPTNEIVHQLAYMAYFIMACRSAKMIKRMKRETEKWTSEVTSTLYREVTRMKEFLYGINDVTSNNSANKLIVKETILSKLLKAARWQPRLLGPRNQ